MRRFALALLCAGVLPSAAAHAQTRFTGAVTDTAGRPIGGATVVIVELDRAARTDANGAFQLVDLPAGRYTVLVRAAAHAPVTLDVELPRAEPLDVTLAPTAFELEPITVAATRSPSRAMDTPLPVAAVGEDRLARELTVSLAHALTGVPGVNALTTGQEIGKPVIRGLAGSRVLTLDNGSRLEDYSWSDEDGPSVDVRLAQRVEVVRGPASLLYGSDALGGIVNAVPAPVPSANGDRGFARLGAELYGASNNAEFGAAVRGEGATGILGGRIMVIGRKSESLRTPDGELENTGFGAFNGEGVVGVSGDRARGALRVAHYGGEFKLLEAGGPPPGDSLGGEEEAGPERKLADDRAQLTGEYYLGSVRLEAKGQFQRHSLIELSDEAGVPGTPGQEATAFDLLLTTTSLDLLAHHALSGAVHGVAGVSGMYQVNDTRGPIPLVPDARIRTGAVFVVEQLDAGPWNLLAGGRFDTRRLDADANPDLGLAADEQRDWQAASADAGVVFHPVAAVALAANFGRAWRAPNLFELFANGPRIGEARYDIGQPDLETEAATSLDLSVRWETPRVRGEVAAFRNQVGRFIYASPTDEFVDSLRVYQYAQADARLLGAEASVEADVVGPLTVMARADAVRGTNLELDEPLPLIPPARGVFGADLHTRGTGWVHWAHAGAEVEVYAEPTRLASNEVATDGYALVNVTGGAETAVGGRTLRLDLEVRNLFDTAYRSFLSRYKEFALNPGRNVLVRLSAMP